MQKARETAGRSVSDDVVLVARMRLIKKMSRSVQSRCFSSIIDRTECAAPRGMKHESSVKDDGIPSK